MKPKRLMAGLLAAALLFANLDSVAAFADEPAPEPPAAAEPAPEPQLPVEVVVNTPETAPEPPAETNSTEACAPVEESAPAAPDEAVPEAPAPAEGAPETEVPEAVEPAEDAPAEDTPAAEAPATAAPEAPAPAEGAPETEVPEAVEPAAVEPAEDTPAEDAPTAEAPATAAPETPAPVEDAPAEEAPETEAPEAVEPEAIEPEAVEPETEPVEPEAPALCTLQSGAGVAVTGVLPAGTALAVAPANTEAAAAAIAAQLPEGTAAANVQAWDITMTDAAGAAVQPGGSVRVTLPVSSDKPLTVYHLPADAPAEKVAELAPGENAFETTHFSVYAVAEMAEGKPTANADGAPVADDLPAPIATDTHTLTFDPAGGTFVDSSFTGTVTVPNAGKTLFPLVQRAGGSGYYEFKGWRDQSTKTLYRAGEYTPEIYTDTAYVAEWGSSSSSTVTILMKKTKDAVSSPDVITYTIMGGSSKFYLPENPFGKNGTQIFKDWNVEKSTFMGSSTVGTGMVPGQTVDLGYTTTGLTLTANWKSVDDAKITYHYNPPSPDIPAVKDYGTYSHSIYTREKSGFPEPVGYEFLGWNTYSRATEPNPDYAPGKDVTLTDNLDLYAIWKFVEYECTVHEHYIDADGKTENKTVKEAGNKLPVRESLSKYVLSETDKQKDIEGKHYIFDHIVASGIVTSNIANNIVDIYYDADNISPEGGPDGVADKLQPTVTYTIENGTWADETGGKNPRYEVVTLEGGTAALAHVPEGKPDEGFLTSRWNTLDGSAPTSVTGAAAFTLTFVNAENAIFIQPSMTGEEPAEMVYDGKPHTFAAFRAVNVHGEPITGVEVEQKALLPESASRIGATSEDGVWLDLATVLGSDWGTYFTVTRDGKPITENVVISGGTLIIRPRPLDVTVTANSETVTYDSNEHTVSAEYTLEEAGEHGLVAADKGEVGLVTADGKELSLTAAYVAATPAPLSLKKEDLALTGAKAANYTLGTVTYPKGDTLSLTITPRHVDYYTYGGSKVYDGTLIKTDNTVYGAEPGQMAYESGAYKKPGTVYGWPAYTADGTGTDNTAPDTTEGFIIRHSTADDVSRRNEQPSNRPIELGKADAGVYTYTIDFTRFKDTPGEDAYAYPHYEGYDPARQHFADYAITYHNDYITIYPQSIDPANDNQGADPAKLTVYKSTDAKPALSALPDYYTGVYLTEEPQASYEYDGQPHVYAPGLRNDSNAPGYQRLVEGRDYTTTYERLTDGVWAPTDDLTNAGRIRVTFTGIGNYRDSVSREYEITPAAVQPTPEPTPEPSPEPSAEPSPEPSAEPTPAPTPAPTDEPAPTPEPTQQPTPAPAPTQQPVVPQPAPTPRPAVPVVVRPTTPPTDPSDPTDPGEPPETPAEPAPETDIPDNDTPQDATPVTPGVTIEENETPLAGGILGRECCILHLLIMLVALAVALYYTHNRKAHQEDQFDMRRKLELPQQPVR